MGPKPKPIAERLWSRVNRTETCWLWTGAPTTQGYDNMNIEGRVKYVHRISWELHNGKIPEGFQVLHSCDNPLCVNPVHLFLGSQEDNMNDASQKGRTVKWKLDEESVQQIRRLWDTGQFNHYSLGRKFGVSNHTIRKIVTWREWKYV